MLASTQPDLDGIYVQLDHWVNECPVYFKADSADESMGLYMVVIDDGVWAVKVEPTGDNEDTLYAYTEDAEAEDPAKSTEPWFIFDPSTGDFKDVGAKVRLPSSVTSLVAGSNVNSDEIRQKAIDCLI